MSSVSIHPPKTPVTTGSSGVAKATTPNVCKMPGPPAPFVPSPLPNIAKSGNSPKGFSTTVTIEGNPVAIRGATFESIGDIASKGTGGGLISANTQGPAKFISLGSLTVKIEGKNVHLLSDSMLNNCGASGSPPNTGATLMGLKQDDSGKPNPAHCATAIKILTQYERLAKKYGSNLPPKRIAELNRLRDAGTITSNHLPGTLTREFPGEFSGKTLAEIKRECA